MPDTPKILGQAAPSATTETDLYTVPASTNATLSSLAICNRGTAQATVRVSVAEDGDATENKQYLYYDLPIPAKDTFIATIGATLEETDKIRVYASTADVSFQAFGIEST